MMACRGLKKRYHRAKRNLFVVPLSLGSNFFFSTGFSIPGWWFHAGSPGRVLVVSSAPNTSSRGSRPYHVRWSARAAGFTEPRIWISSASLEKRCRERRRSCCKLRCSTGDLDVGDYGVEQSHRQLRGERAVYTLLIDNYDSYTYNLFQQLAVINGRAPFVVYNDDDSGDLGRAIERMECTPDNIVISPGPGRPDVPADFGMCAQALREASDMPILGVCLGHEGLGLAHGAEVIRANEPMHGRLSSIFHDGDPLFRGVPQGTRVVRYHSLVVDPATLPGTGELKPTAWTADGVIMAMRHQTRPHWGVQFHPESVGTRHGSDIVQNFRDLTLEWRRANRQKNKGEKSPSPKSGTRHGATIANLAEIELTAGRGAEGADFGENIIVFPPFLSVPVVVPSPSVRAPPEISTSKAVASERCIGQHRFVLHVQELAVQDALSNDRNTDGGVGRNGDEVTLECLPDPEDAFRAIYGDKPTAWWLDSSNRRPGVSVDGQAKARFTFMGGADGPLSRLIECYGNNTLIIETSEAMEESFGCAGGDGVEYKRRRQHVCANVLDYLKAEMTTLGCSGEPSSDLGPELRISGRGQRDSDPRDEKRDGRYTLPFEFLGGYVGFLGYELRHEASDILRRSVGGTEWHWQPPNGVESGEERFGERNVDGLGPAGSVRRDGGSNARRAEGEPEGGTDVPLGFLVFADRFVAFDHEENKVFLLALADEATTVGDGDTTTAERKGKDGHGGHTGVASASGAEALKWIRQTAGTVRDISSTAFHDDRTARQCRENGTVQTSNGGEEANLRPATGAATAGTSCVMDVPRSRYERSLSEIMRLIAEGETYEVCLTNQIVCERPGAGRIPPLDLYARLRRSNPAPYAAFLVHDPHKRLLTGDGRNGERAPGDGTGPSFAVCCSSPERFLKVDRHGWAESKPIKGTVKRGNTPAEDLALATALSQGEKSMAENLMIVDLVRNDLGRVCRTGTVSVPKLMHVESYATVHQLVSTIRGRLRPGCGALDAIAAAFPGGSMTGAPKRRTMDIIDRLEGGRSRGVYSGSIGFLSLNGAADLNIVIRTAVVTPKNVTVGAGGAVIALSEIADEYEEMLLKASSVLGAIGHEQRPGTRGPLGSEPTAREVEKLDTNAVSVRDGKRAQDTPRQRVASRNGERVDNSRFASEARVGRVQGARREVKPTTVGQGGGNGEILGDGRVYNRRPP